MLRGAAQKAPDLTLDLNAPIPNGQVWNMTYAPGDGGFMPAVTSEELWGRLQSFLEQMLPVAEEAAQTAEYFGSCVERVYDVGPSFIRS